MGQVALNVHAALMQNSQTNRKNYNASKDGSNNFDRILADKFNESTTQRTSKNNSVTNKSIQKSSGNTNRTNQDTIGAEEDIKTKKDLNGKDQNFETEITLMMQSMEEIMQLINVANTISGEFNIEDFQGMLDDLKIQLNELLAQVEQFGLSNSMVNGVEGLDFKSLQGMMLDAISALEGVNHSNQNNIKTAELDAMLAKLQDVLGKQLENLKSVAETSTGGDQNGLLNHMKLGDEGDRGKGLNQLEEQTVDLTESLRGSSIENDETDETNHENLDQGSEKQGGLFSGFKSNVEGTNSQQQVETQFVKFDQINIVEQAKSETTVTQTVKLNNIIDQVASKVMVHVGEDGSEMSLQLKPEHLGKLTMKVSIERGIVVANFVAESQMVKEVLESNFNILKDALQEKGLAIQELNVFVGSDSNFQNQKNFMTFQRKMNKGNSSYNDSSYGNAVEEITQMAPKSLNSSKLDFFA
ncbi:flagellar hook-length control protein FliK [Anaerosolibacter sp.]|uniref:flagellar hook-length control protein FliK n=1 Tax=Anaerosolibacter sp. TaxID=1872527 RepID=UPI0039EE1E87